MRQVELEERGGAASAAAGAAACCGSGAGGGSGASSPASDRTHWQFNALFTRPAASALVLRCALGCAGWASLWAGACSAWATRGTLCLALEATCRSPSPPRRLR